MLTTVVGLFDDSITIPETRKHFSGSAEAASGRWRAMMRPQSALHTGIRWRSGQAIYVFGGNNASGNLDSTESAVPEPATLSLLALGGLVLMRRRRA